MREVQVAISIVLYHNTKEQISKLLGSFAKQEVSHFIFLIDNSEKPLYQPENFGENIHYQHSTKNLGYGGGHNLGIFNPTVKADYHLICNPDVYFEGEVLGTLSNYLDQHQDVGTVMPDIRFPSGERQRLVKLLPKPSDLFLRRFLPKPIVKALLQKQAARYEMKGFDLSKELEVPVLSGCFLFCRRDLLQKVGGFDTRYFLYMEDVDLSRRLSKEASNRFVPNTKIVHEYQKDSYKKPRHLKYHISSAIKYFNKFGWVFDTERDQINQKAEAQESQT